VRAAAVPAAARHGEGVSNSHLWVVSVGGLRWQGASKEAATAHRSSSGGAHEGAQ
jgi:hypothetical protein